MELRSMKQEDNPRENKLAELLNRLGTVSTLEQPLN